MLRLAVLACAAVACGGDGDGDPAATVAADPGPEVRRPAAPDADPEAPAVERIDAPPPGSLPAWDAVIQRADLVARRGQRGIIHGRVAVHGGERYLVDETDGAGALGVRLHGVDLDAGARAAVWGAWEASADRGWRWRASKVARLPAAEVDPDPYAATRPDHVIETIDRPPAGTIVIEQVPRAGGGVFFQVIRGPVRPGDGWIVAGRSHWPPAAIILLPGDREPYGAQDLRSPGEIWRLEPKQSYVVRVARKRPASRDGVPVLRAVSPPKRVAAE